MKRLWFRVDFVVLDQGCRSCIIVCSDDAIVVLEF